MWQWKKRKLNLGNFHHSFDHNWSRCKGQTSLKSVCKMGLCLKSNYRERLWHNSVINFYIHEKTNLGYERVAFGACGGMNGKYEDWTRAWTYTLDCEDTSVISSNNLRSRFKISVHTALNTISCVV
jgi:hypothetical protein